MTSSFFFFLFLDRYPLLCLYLTLSSLLLSMFFVICWIAVGYYEARSLRYINEKKHLHPKSFIRSHCGELARGIECARNVFMRPCGCVFPFKFCQCDTFITGDINEPRLKLWKDTRWGRNGC